MKFVRVEELKEGMILAADVRDVNGNLLFKRGRIIDSNIKKSLKEKGVYVVPVQIKVVKKTNKIVKNKREEKKEKEYGEIKFVPDEARKFSVISEDLLNQAYNNIKMIFKRFERENVLNIGGIEKTSKMLIEEILDKYSDIVAIPLKKLKNYDEYTYSHSLNVGIISTIIGVEMGMEEEALMRLMMAGILHDVGKYKVPPEILNAPRKLEPEEFEVIKKHVVFSKEICLEYGIDGEDIIGGALDHHERWNGSGYYYGKKEQEISLFGRIISIADVYDALTSKRVYKDPWDPYTTISAIVKGANKSYDPYILSHFLDAFGVYPVGTILKLSNGKEGIVVGVRRENKVRPLVRIDGEEVDLSKRFDVRILGVVKNE